ncbi:NADH-quinone oxidoreductase subunit N 1 [Candidatus Sulfotelmatobacter kueseliae]|uniref:NADH-quinone oxidoreductase subunit N n=1 Tax=Candidatus Sulfotelmatobacter kueseliae TaxID=2042962 RepID=A0A2U3KXL1_9BACT|nr:NADH-quinone oxidoreductase subunit N 1 [Candidatus Sulfotelmatobacter kueseliae]
MGPMPGFSATDYVMALPITLLTLFALGILLIDLMLPKEQKWANAITALIGLGFSAKAVYNIQHWLGRAPAYPGMMGTMLVDRFAVYFFYLFLAGTAIAILMSVRYLETEDEHHGEYYALMLLSVVGMMCMAAGYDIVLIFIGLELMAISTYVLVGFLRRDRRSNEAALKYLLLGAFSSGIFAYGLSLFYGLTGSTNLGVISNRLFDLMQRTEYKPLLVVALLTTITGLFFKIAAVPFHQWAPDAYEGAPTSITGFMSVAVKAAGWAMLLRILIGSPFHLGGLVYLRPLWFPVVIFVSIATMTGANFAALTQTNTKRLLAYSSIAHVGYMLLGLVAGTATELNPDGIKGILIYLLVYTFMNLGAFGVITSLRHKKVIGDELDDLNGLYSRAPVEAVLMLVFMLSLAGIPPLAGFWGKYFIFLSLISTGHYALASLGVLYSVFGLYYYLKIANAMFMRQPEKGEEKLPVSYAMRAALGLTGFATLFIGILPDSFIRMVNWALGIVQNPSVARLVR